MVKGKKVGLALSGGGYRAAAFHLGTLEKLHEMGILDKIDIISTVSGGSIIGAYYCYCLSQGYSFEEFSKSMKENLKRNLEVKTFINQRTILVFLFILLACVLISMNISYLAGILSFFIGLIFVFFIRPKIMYFNFTEIKAYWYDKYYYNEATLSNLPDKPLLVINSTNFENGKMWVFTNDIMGDYTYTFDQDKKFKHKGFPLSFAVASSSAVPGIFEPIKIEKKFFEKERYSKKYQPALSDGGVYDNQGIHKLAHPKSRYKCH